MSETARSGPDGPTASASTVLLICTGATFMAFLDLSVVNIAFPKIIDSFEATPLTTLTWIVSGYAVLFAAVLTPAGRLADTVGRTKVFVWSLAGFVLASLACGAATSPTWLISGRLVQGALAAGMIPAALGLILSTTPPQLVTKAIGTWSAVAGFSAVIGPALGGFLVEQFSWRSIFYINVPIGLTLLVIAVRALPRHQATAQSRFPDVIGTVAFAAGIGMLVTALTEGDSWGWSSTRTLGLAASGLVLGLFAVLRSRRHPAPAIAIDLWKSRPYAIVNLVSVLIGVSMFAWLLAAALFATSIWNWSILQAAGAMSVGAVASMVTSVIAGQATKPVVQRWFVILGALMFAACTAWMGSDALGNDPQFWSVWVPTGILGGGGLGFAVTSLSSIAAGSLPPTQFAAGVGMNLTARQLGGALGTAMLAAILSSAHATALDGFHDLYRACTVASLLAAVAGLALLQRSGSAPTPAARSANRSAEVAGG